MGLFSKITKTIKSAVKDVGGIAKQVYSTPGLGALLPGGAFISPALMAYNAARGQGQMGSVSAEAQTLPVQPSYYTQPSYQPAPYGQVMRRSSRMPVRKKRIVYYTPRRKGYFR